MKALMDFKKKEPLKSLLYRVPAALRRQNEDAYSPCVVSIGPLQPYWEGPVRLRAMKNRKLSYMCCLFDRTGTYEVTNINCVSVMLMMEKELDECYAEIDQLNERPRYAQTMLIDGCFIIELLYRKYIDQEDPILHDAYQHLAVQHDLLLLENQIPFFVLEELFELTIKRIPENEFTKHSLTLTECVLSFFGDIMIGQKNATLEPKENVNPYHILHLLHNYYLPLPGKQLNYYRDEEQLKTKHSATQFRRAGGKFQAGNGTDLFDLKFSAAPGCFGLLTRDYFQIPSFSIYELTEPFLRNLIAFEQCCPLVNNFFTSHAFLMSILINSETDAKLLQDAGIINNYLGSSETVAQLFKDICKNVVPRRIIYAKVNNQMVGKTIDSWIYRRAFWRFFFNNMWVRMTVIGAIVLNVLALLSSIYTMLSYYRN